MTRLIDANSILDDFLKRYTEIEKDEKLVFAACEIKQDFADMISNATTVDAVEVVRCRDCAVPHNKYTGCPELNGRVTPPDFYCPFGERRDGND